MSDASDKVMIVDKAGKRFLVPTVNLNKALATGEYRPAGAADQKASGYAQEPGRAGLEAGARGLTLGLSDPILKGLGVPEEDLRGRKEQNPAASALGEVGGTVAGLLVPGGAAGLAAKAGRVAEAGMLARGAGAGVARFVGGGLEGSLYGLGKVIDEHALGEPQSNAEKLVALSGLGGGLLNVLGGKLGEIASDASLKAFGGKKMSEYLKTKAEDILISKLARPGELAKRNLAERAQEVMRYGLDNDLIKGTIPESLSAAAAHRASIGDEMGNVMRSADEDALGFYDSTTLGLKAENQIIPKMMKDPANEGAVNGLRKYIQGLKDRELTLGDMWENQSSLLKKLPETEPAMKGAYPHLREFRDMMRDDLLEAAGNISPYHEKVLTLANQKYAKARELEKFLAARSREEMSGASFNLPDELAGEASSLLGYAKYGPKGILLGAGGAVLHKTLREKGALGLARGLDALAESSFPKIADDFRKVIQNQLDSGANFGTFRSALENAVANGAEGLLAQHVQMSKDPAYMKALGLEHETPEATGDYATKFVQLDAMQRQLAVHNEMALDAIKTMLGKTAGRPANAPTPISMQQYREARGMVESVMRSPDLQAKMSPPGMEGVAPVTAMLVGQTRLAGIQFLAGKLPKDPNEGKLAAFSSKWQAPTCEIARFGRYLRAVDNPATVFTDARNGHPSVEGIEVLRAVYPALFADYQKLALEHVSQMTEHMPYQQRTALASIFGPDFAGQDPRATKLIQDMHAATLSGSGPGGGGPTKDGRQEVDSAKNMETQAQRLEARSQGK